MSERQNDYRLRKDILDLLSDDEEARVSTAETAPHLEEGDEFIDLQELEEGVLVADGVKIHMGHVLPRKAVLADTWFEIRGLIDEHLKRLRV
jgi:hypothetical protein